MKLFPSSTIESLSDLSHDDLIKAMNPTSEAQEVQNEDQGEEALEMLAPGPQQEFVWDESANDSTYKVNDDVNGLSLSTNTTTSYLGVSSVNIILRAIVQLAPQSQVHLLRYESPTAAHFSPDSLHPRSIPNEDVLIDAYFLNLNSMIPIVEESSFRAKYASSGDKAPSWRALVNMVLCLGSLSTDAPDESSHVVFYERARQHMSIDCFGAGSLEIIQALGLLGGHYYHKVNKPNQANVVMGAALRMATAMGLHLEPRKRKESLPDRHIEHFHEVRRRIWWSLFCLDTLASFTLGRPTMGRWDPTTITVQPPTKLTTNVSPDHEIQRK